MASRILPWLGAIASTAALVVAIGCGGSGAPDPERAARLLEAGDRDGAVAAVRGFEPRTPQEWGLLAAVYSGARGHEEAAIHAFEPLAESGDPQGCLLAAQVASEADRPGVGAEWLVACLDRHPEVDELAVEAAKLYGRLGRHRESVALLSPRAGGDPRLLNLTGYAWLLAEDPDKARAFLQRSIDEARSLGRDYAPPHYHLGMLLAAEGELERALDEFRTAMRANPNHLEAHYQALVMAERLGDEAAAEVAREGFSRLYRERLEAGGALSAMPTGAESERVYRGVSFEARRAVDEPTFTRSLPAGSTLELAFLAPADGEASFTVAPEGGETFSVVHAGEPHEAVWVPHVLELPPGAGEVQVEFRVEPASAMARMTGGDAPEGAAIAEPRVLAPVEARSSDERPNVLVFSLDTLRADRVGAYGHDRDTTPFVDELAAGGALFRRAQAPSNWTLPSHYSIFSGLTPVSHGVMPDLGDVRGYIHPDRQLAIRGSGREVMLAERLEEVGYRTAAVTENGWVSARFGFDQGFQIYRSAAAGSLPGTLAGALAELELAGERGPWFLFVHTYAPHQPYHAPRALRTRWAARDHVGFAWPEARVPIDDYYRFRNRWFLPTPSDVTTFFDLYDGQTAWADGLVGDIVGWLEARGLLEQTLIVVTSDHGEEIFERGQFDHGDTLFEEVTHVPLVLHAPGRVPAGVSVGGAVSLVDLPATILDLVGLGDVHGQGRSLMPLVRGDESAGERIVHAQATGHGGEPLFAVWRGSRKYVVRETGDGPVRWCFDLAVDPREARNLIGTPSCDEAGFGELLDEHRAAAAEIREALGAGEGAVDAETLERLKSLGYAQ